MIWIRLATEEDVAQMAPKLRQADKNEVWASDGYSPLEALRTSYSLSKPCFTAVLDDEPLAMFGTVPILSNVGSIWLLGTDSVSKAPTSFLRWSRRLLPFLLQPYDMVCNLVDARNTVHIRWIRWLGFTFIRKTTHGPQQLPFYEFARLAKCVDL